MDTLRSEEKSTYEETKLELEKAVAGIQKVLNVLKDYYAKAAHHGENPFAKVKELKRHACQAPKACRGGCHPEGFLRQGKKLKSTTKEGLDIDDNDEKKKLDELKGEFEPLRSRVLDSMRWITEVPGRISA